MFYCVETLMAVPCLDYHRIKKELQKKELVRVRFKKRVDLRVRPGARVEARRSQKRKIQNLVLKNLQVIVLVAKNLFST